jgi:ankyrin repeat protein
MHPCYYNKSHEQDELKYQTFSKRFNENKQFSMPKHPQMFFEKACENNNIELAKWLLSIGGDKIDILQRDSLIFRESCNQDQFEIVKWLLDIIGDKINASAYYDAFFTCCQSEQLEMAKLLLSVENNKINISVNDDYAFIESCYAGHIEMAKWLLSIEGNKIDISANDNCAFFRSCYAGHIEIAKWLIGLDINITNTTMNETFEIVCLNGQVETAKWLLSLENYTIDISANDNHAFVKSCSHGLFKMSEWLLSISNNKINISKYEHFILTDYGSTNIETILEWMDSIGHKVQFQVLDSVFEEACNHSEWNVVDMLENKYGERYSHKIVNDAFIIPYIVKYKTLIDSMLVIDGICSVCCISDCNCKTNCDHNYCMECVSLFNKMTYNCPLCSTFIDTIYKNNVQIVPEIDGI